MLASTTSVENSGLLGYILPIFTRETGIEVRVVAQGTGQALTTAAKGDAEPCGLVISRLTARPSHGAYLLSGRRRRRS